MREFPPQKQILVIESDQDLLDELASELSGLGLEIKSFASGDEALNSLKDGFPDYVLTPFDAVGYDQKLFVHCLAGLGLLKHIPVIVTGYDANERTYEEALNMDVFLKRDCAEVPSFVRALAY